MKTRLLVPLLLAFAVACNSESENNDESGGESDDEVVVDQALLDAGDAIFAGVCSDCHGADGTGLFNAANLTVVVPDMTETEVRDAIVNGSGNMQPPEVAESEVAAIVYYVMHTFGS